MFSTHGLVPGELNGLTQPALALSSPEVTGDQDDGLLTMDKVIALKLDADWVVLSACNTAAGEGAGSEAVSGLGRAFFFAGAKALLVSNWPVDSLASRQLMTDLFKRQQQNPGLAKSEALRQAMLYQVDQGGMKEGNTMKYSYAHPLFWAPFVVVGD
jgi:CHAT domain-containing protein